MFNRVLYSKSLYLSSDAMYLFAVVYAAMEVLGQLLVIRKLGRCRYNQAELVSTRLPGNKFPDIVNK